jgi:hypothetical protein
VIVDVSAGAIHRMLSAELAPVVVFLHADSVAAVRKQNPTFDEAACVQVHDLALKVCSSTLAERRSRHSKLCFVGKKYFA